MRETGNNEVIPCLDYMEKIILHYYLFVKYTAWTIMKKYQQDQRVYHNSYCD